MPIELSLSALDRVPLLRTKLLLSRVTTAPPFFTAIEPVLSMVILPDAVVVRAVVVAVETSVSARAGRAKRTAAAAESIKRCLIKSPTSLFASGDLNRRYPAFLRQCRAVIRGPRHTRGRSRHLPGWSLTRF